jgi:signal transduction protein with GAF and PtsI domain
MTIYFGFAIADSMIPDNADIQKRKLEIDEAKKLIQSAVPCVNASHTARIEAMTERFGIQVEIPEKPPMVKSPVW